MYIFRVETTRAQPSLGSLIALLLIYSFRVGQVLSVGAEIRSSNSKRWPRNTCRNKRTPPRDTSHLLARH